MDNTEVKKRLIEVENKLTDIHNEYRKMDVQRARLEGKEVTLLDMKDLLRELAK